MKAIVVRQPWATLIALGVKTIETRPGPPNGPMRPAGVRGLPGCRLEQGERIAIVAGATAERFGPAHEAWTELASALKVYRWQSDVPDGEWMAEAAGEGAGVKGKTPLGAVVCTVVVSGALPIVANGIGYCGRDISLMAEPLTRSLLAVGENGWGIASLHAQLPFGDFAPGRWGWMLAEPEPCKPIPCKGKQGVFVLPENDESRPTI